MLDPILQGLREVDGVQGAMVVDPAAAVVAHRAHAMYDLPLLQQVARSIVNLVDSVQLIQDDWEILTAHFGDGKLVLRSLKSSGAKPRRYVLAVIADATLNIAFLGVALRVAATKTTAALDGVAAAMSTPPASAASIPSASFPSPSIPSASIPPASPAPAPSIAGRLPLVAEPSAVGPARSGIAWSGGRSNSGVDGSAVEAADAASAALLTAFTTALATSQGPIAKVFVRDGVRKVCSGRPFSRLDAPALIEHLAGHIDDPRDRAAFHSAARRL